MVGDASKVHPPAAKLEEEQHIHPSQKTVSTVKKSHAHSQQPAGAETTANSSRHAAAPGQGHGRAESCGSSWPTPGRQGATAHRGCAGSATGGLAQAARPGAAPPPRSAAVRWIWSGRSSAGPPRAGASAAASQAAPGLPTSAPVGAAGSRLRRSHGRWVVGGAVDAGGAAPPARGVTPGSRSP